MADFLIREHGFTRLYLERTSPTPSVEKSATNVSLPTAPKDSEANPLVFHDADDLLDFATTRWQERWVTSDVWDEFVLDVYLRRPWFVLISVDAPVSVRWERFKSRSVPCTSMIAQVHKLISLDAQRTI